MNAILAIAAGGALGAVMRHGANTIALQWLGDGFPYGTFFVNVVGAFLIGIVITIFDYLWTPSDVVRAFAITGVLSAFTTFSTFSLDVIHLLERQQYLHMSLYFLGSVTLSIAGLLVAIHLTKAFIS